MKRKVLSEIQTETKQSLSNSSVNLSKVPLQPEVVFRDRIVGACTDNVPHLYESIKHYACEISKLYFMNSEYKNIGKKSWEKIFDDVFEDLVQRKLILKSPRQAGILEMMVNLNSSNGYSTTWKE